MKELKTKCYQCKGTLYQGKFWIYGFNDRKYCSKTCMLIKEKERAKEYVKVYSDSPQLRKEWEKECFKLNNL